MTRNRAHERGARRCGGAGSSLARGLALLLVAASGCSSTSRGADAGDEEPHAGDADVEDAQLDGAGDAGGDDSSLVDGASPDGTVSDSGTGDGPLPDAGCRPDQVQEGMECRCPDGEHERSGQCVPDVERHPGHWVLLSDLESIRVAADAPPEDREDLAALDEIAASTSNVAGVLVRFFWRDLNPSEGGFAMGRMQEHLDRLAEIADGGGPSLQYAPLITWRSYLATDHPMPAYLAGFEEPAGEGHRGQVWKPAVRARYRELLEAIRSTVGDHPHFGGVSTQETAVGPPPRDGYSAGLYAEALVDIGAMHREVFPTEEIFFIFNFLSATPADCEGLDRETECGSWPPEAGGACGPCLLGGVLERLAALEIALGGPDILPDSAPLVDNVYPHYGELDAAGATLFCHAQKDSYRVDDGGGYLPMQDIFEYARDQLSVDYVFWFHKETGTGQSYSDAVPVIAGNPWPWR